MHIVPSSLSYQSNAYINLVCHVLRSSGSVDPTAVTQRSIHAQAGNTEKSRFGSTNHLIYIALLHSHGSCFSFFLSLFRISFWLASEKAQEMRSGRAHKHLQYHAWSQQLVSALHSTETQVHLSEATPEVDNHLLHLWEARHSLVRRWRRQKHNRQLKIRIAELTQRAAEYAAQLADSNWVDRCNTAA